jgi:hypothetical protein
MIFSAPEKFPLVQTVSFSLPADTPPTATVIVNVTLSMQLNAVGSRRQAVQNRVVLLTFTTANYQTAQNIVVDAWDDRLVEGGTHLGVLQFKVMILPCPTMAVHRTF